MLDAGKNIITRHLPKTGQVTSYTAGDDGDYEKGWWRGRLNANNRERWIQKAIVGDDIVVDRATGLMWPTDWIGAGAFFGGTKVWSGPGGAIPWINALNFASFTDWRIPNITELMSLIEYSGAQPYIYQPPFQNIMLDNCWSGTTWPGAPLMAYVHNWFAGINFIVLKTSTQHLIAVRDSAL